MTEETTIRIRRATEAGRRRMVSATAAAGIPSGGLQSDIFDFAEFSI